MRRLHALAEPLPDGRARRRIEGRQLANPRGERGHVFSREALGGVDERVEDGVRGEHRHTACRSLVHDLVGSARAHVVHEPVVGREEQRHLRPRHGAAQRDAALQLELSHKLREVGPMCALLVREGRPVHVQADAAARLRDGLDE